MLNIMRERFHQLKWLLIAVVAYAGVRLAWA